MKIGAEYKVSHFKGCSGISLYLQQIRLEIGRERKRREDLQQRSQSLESNLGQLH